MTEKPRRSNFLTDIIDADLAAQRYRGRVATRFPPEPNGFLHIGHAKSIVLNFETAKQYGGEAHLRFDDTNPTTEEAEYVESIQRDVCWLGYDWGAHLYYASDFFDRMYECATRLIKSGKAYVDSQDASTIRERRGNFERPGTDSPYRSRDVSENLELFRRMRDGEFPDGASVLRGKIDMSHPNVLMRDPLLYRIRHAHHHRTANKWCIYPMYDFAHPLEDAFEGITHSFCTLEFESNRELYDWVLDNLGPWDPRPRQYEFARLMLGYTVLSKRKLLQLVQEKRVSGWDDPRMPTIAGMRRRGVTPDAIRDFAEMIGVAKNNSLVDIGKFEFAVRSDLENRAPKAMAVVNPLKVTLTNWPTDRIDEIEIPWWPGEPDRAGVRKVPFGANLFIERDDYADHPPKGWKRLAPGRSVRLIGAPSIQCDEVIRSESGEVIELRCTVNSAESQTLKSAGILHWVEASRSLPAQVRLYGRLFDVEQPDADDDFLKHLNPDSLVIAANARLEPALAQASLETRFQFLRQGYFFGDPVDSKPDSFVFNRIISLKDTQAKKATRKPTGRESAKPRPVTEPKAKRNRTDPRDELRAKTPLLAERFTHYQAALKLPLEMADVLTGDLELASFFDAAIAHADPSSVAKWLVNDLLGLIKDKTFAELPLTPMSFGRFVALVDSGRMTQAAAKPLLSRLVEAGGEPEELAQEMGLDKVLDHASVEEAVAKVIRSQESEVARYRAGEKKLLGVLIGAAMRETRGTADAAAVRKALTKQLGS